MPDYSTGKIYQIVPTCDYEEGDIYIGSTIRPLSERMGSHRTKSDGCKSKLLFLKYGVENCKIELIEEYPCANRNLLLKREGEIQRSLKCINKKIAGQTYQDRIKLHPELLDIKKTYNKTYGDLHRAELNEKQRIYCETRREELCEKSKQYVIKNQDHVKEYQKAYRLAHKEQTKIYNKEYRLTGANTNGAPSTK